jgi:hypothetical protein
MSWQNDYQIDGGKRVGGRLASAVLIIVFLITAATYHHHQKDDVEAVSGPARGMPHSSRARSP